MIHVKDALVLMEQGKDPALHYNAALQRCHDAIVDQAAEGRPNVKVSVFKLTDAQYSDLENRLKEQGFIVVFLGKKQTQYVTHMLNIYWSNDAQSQVE